MIPLPIDPHLPRIVDALRREGTVVIEAPPGAGKTTRVPRALLEAGVAGTGEVLVLEPRRLAARLAARRVAGELGEPPGRTVGYRVRFEEAGGPGTRLWYVTEGVLARRLVPDPALRGVGAVILDEFHERHLPGDLSLAFLKGLRRTARPDLKLVVMSATLDAGPVTRYLGAPTVRAEGRLHDVAVEYLSPAEARDGEPVERRVARAVGRLAARGLDGDVLVFLPGMAEILEAARACRDVAARYSLDLLPLHGDLSPREQDRAVLPGPRRKVVLATNVAETSVTIEGVTAVVDSGLARVASHSPWSGLPRLEVRRISRASAAQRAGRAGRTAPGRVLRLYTRHDHDARPPFDAPEVLREDLAEAALLLAALSAPDVEWLDPPPAAAIDAARSLLRRLGAAGPSGEATALGRRMLRYPLHPRLSRFLLEAHARGAGEAGAVVAALLSERDIRERGTGGTRAGGPPTGPSDLLELAYLFGEARKARFDAHRVRALGLAPAAVAAAERSRRHLAALLGRERPGGESPSRPAGPPAGEAEEPALLLAILAAYPDRVARRRAPGSPELLLSEGGSARLDPGSVVRGAEFLVAVDAEERRGVRGRAPGPGGGAVVRLASAVTPGMLRALFPGEMRTEAETFWNVDGERAEARERLMYGALVVEERRKADVDPSAASALLAEAALARGARAFDTEGRTDALNARLAFAARSAPGAVPGPFGEEAVAGVLREACAGKRSFRELADADLPGALLSRLSPRQRDALERLAPPRVVLPGGRSLEVRYDPAGKPPFVESRLQDFFGLARGPVVGESRVPLVLHLLAPNRRAVQVTSDLAGFWERHYPALRKELMRRYPKHAWPQDPLRSPGRGGAR